MLYGRAEGRGFHLPLSDGTLAAGAGIWCCVLVLARIVDPPSRRPDADYDLRWGFLVRLLVGRAARRRGRARAAALPPRPERGAGRGRRTPTRRTPADGLTPADEGAGHRRDRQGRPRDRAARSPQRGDEVRALVRDPARAAGVLPAGVEPVRGDVTDPASLERGRGGMRGRVQRDGPAGAVGARTRAVFDRVNAEGTRAVAQAARARRRAAPGAHEHRGRVPRRARRALRRVPGRRLPEGHRLRALQAARRAACAGRSATASRS